MSTPTAIDEAATIAALDCWETTGDSDHAMGLYRRVRECAPAEPRWHVWEVQMEPLPDRWENRSDAVTEDLAGYYATRAAHDRLAAREARREAMRQGDRSRTVRTYSALAIIFIALTVLALVGMLAAEGNGHFWATLPFGALGIISAGGAIAMLSRREKAAAEPEYGVDEEVGE